MNELIADELVGWKIVSPLIETKEGEDFDGDTFYGFVAQKGKEKKCVWVSRDSEGNGPGHLDIEPSDVGGPLVTLKLPRTEKD
jgi:hypothetical protein